MSKKGRRHCHLPFLHFIADQGGSPAPPAAAAPAARYGLRVEDAVFDAKNLAGGDVDEQGVRAVSDPHISVRRIDQAEVPVSVQPVVARPERDRQVLAIGPLPVVPAIRLSIGRPVIAPLGIAGGLIGTRIEVPVVLVPLRRTVARRIGGPIVAVPLRVLLPVLLATLLAPLLLALAIATLIAGLAVLLTPLLLAMRLAVLAPLLLTLGFAILLGPLLLALGLAVLLSPLLTGLPLAVVLAPLLPALALAALMVLVRPLLLLPSRRGVLLLLPPLRDLLVGSRRRGRGGRAGESRCRDRNQAHAG